MAESFLIALREGFEAALIVAIVLAFVRRQAPEQARAVWLGTGAAVALAIVVGIILDLTLDGLAGTARLRTFAVICVAAAALLTWMIFWMRSHARALRGELEGRAGVALASGSSMGLALVAFTAVAREGLETALFLLSTSVNSDGRDVIVGTLAGLAVAVVLGVGVYQGSHLFDLRKFFLVTGVLIILFAAGLVSRAVLFLQASNDLGSFDDAVYNLTRYPWLTQQSQVGRFLAGIFGWDPRPSIEQVVGYLGFLLPALYVLFKRPTSKPAAIGIAQAPLQPATD